ncbi:hypothetical protein BpHYR1_048447 [Brachionus plicatilis]|uniref:Uncharacterized protein n=1 Tax=Brachionus plicatilis TaxID=10195 RepID=A0A3M7RMS7_BRAPC|nr:hypothetical protein BpHYR1_048447 [Brachionus plicatilis]
MYCLDVKTKNIIAALVIMIFIFTILLKIIKTYFVSLLKISLFFTEMRIKEIFKETTKYLYKNLTGISVKNKKKLYKIFIKCLTGVQSAYNVHFEKLKITNKHIQTKLANLTLLFILNFGSIQKPIKNKPYQLNNQSFRMKYFVRKYSCKISKKIMVKFFDPTQFRVDLLQHNN